MLPAWLRSLVFRNHRPIVRRLQPRLWLERLEDRLTPALDFGDALPNQPNAVTAESTPRSQKWLPIGCARW